MGIVVFSTTEIVVYYLVMLRAAETPKKASEIVNAMFQALGGAVTTIKKIKKDK